MSGGNSDEILEAWARLLTSDPGRVVVRSEGATPYGSAISVGALDTARNEVADRLAAAGVRRGEVIALAAPPGAQWIVAFLAARTLGAIVALFDTAGPRAERRWTAERLGARWTWEPSADGPASTAMPTRIDGRGAPPPCEAAVIKLTSGSTGPPKGLLVSSAALLADGRNLCASIGLDENDRALAVLPLEHSYGFSVLMAPMLLVGMPLLFAGTGSPLEYGRRHGATFLPCVPSWLRVMLPLNPRDRWRGSLRRIMTAGAPLEPALARTFRESTGHGVHVLYGSSEVGAIAYDRTGSAAERGTVGTAAEGVSLSIAGDRLHVESPGAAFSSWPSAEDSGVWLDGPDDHVVRRFVAADRVRLRDGELELLGRADRIVKVRGKRVDPARVERVLARMDRIREAAVCVIELPNGRGAALRAVVTLEPGAKATPLEILREAKGELAGHEIPRGIVVTSELPRNGRGKLDRTALIEIASSALERA